MKIFELRVLSTVDLLQRLKDETESLENLRFQRTIGQLENFKNINNTRKSIARIKTLLAEREKQAENKKIQ